MKTVNELEAEQVAIAQRAMQSYAKLCESMNLNQKSQSSLLGIARQTWINYKTGERAPCRGAVARLKLIVPRIKQAEQDGLLPTDERRSQSGIVEKILSQ